jgi:PAS domain-containing protein
MRSDNEIQAKDITFNTPIRESSLTSKEMTLQGYTYHIIRNYLNKYDNNVLDVARKLDIGKSSIYRYLKKWNLKEFKMKSLSAYVKKGLFYKSVVEDGSDIIFIVNYEGTILYHNHSVKETLGYKTSGLSR